MSGLEDCVGALTVKTSPEYAMKHGACEINKNVRREGGREGGVGEISVAV